MAKKKKTKQSYEEYLADQYKFQETWQRYGFNETCELLTAKDQYFINCNDSYLADLIRHGKEIGQPTRDFIADILEGKVKRKKGQRRNNWHRDYEIGLEIYKMVDIKKSHNLTSGWSDGAAAIIANKYGLEENTAIDIYYEMKPGIENRIRFSKEAKIAFDQDDLWGNT